MKETERQTGDKDRISLGEFRKLFRVHKAHLAWAELVLASCWIFLFITDSFGGPCVAEHKRDLLQNPKASVSPQWTFASIPVLLRVEMTLNGFIPNISFPALKPCLFLEWELSNYLDQAPCYSPKQQARRNEFQGPWLGFKQDISSQDTVLWDMQEVNF